MDAHKCGHNPPTIVQFNPTLPPILTTVVMRAIRCDPENRYASMDDLLQVTQVIPVDYRPCPAKLSGRYRQVIRVALLVMIIFLALITFGILVQLIQPAARSRPDGERAFE